MLIEERASPRARQARPDRCARDPAPRSPTQDLQRGLEEVALVVTDGEPLGRRVPIGSAPLIIGRGADVDMQIVDPTVSRHHCVIWRAAGRCWIRDLGSTNHTRVNDRSARITELFEGDIVVIGQTALTLATTADDAPPIRICESHTRDAGVG
jgi:pSer/pThr/pTyr-binding forkhead associated (FHA) protein